MKTLYFDSRVSVLDFADRLGLNEISKENISAWLQTVRGLFTLEKIEEIDELPNVTVGGVCDEANNPYRWVNFDVNTSYELKGQVWACGSKFEINVTEYYEGVQAVIDEFYASEKLQVELAQMVLLREQEAESEG